MYVRDQKEAWDSFYRTNSRPWRGTSSVSRFPFPDGGRILELGCGNGKTALTLIENGFRVTGVDFSQNAVDACVKNIGEKGEFVCASIDNLPFGDSIFDGAVVYHVLEHLDETSLKRTVSEISRVLVPGSHLLVKVFSVDDMRSDKGERLDVSTVVRGNGIRYHYFTEDELCQVFDEFETCAISTVSEMTRFGEIRIRIEADFLTNNFI